MATESSSEVHTVSEQCRYCHGTKHTTSYGKLLCALASHRVEMRIMKGLVEANDLEDELEELTIEETGNTGFWLGHNEEFDVIVEDTEKLEMQKRLAEKADEARFIQAIRGGLKLQKVNAELAEVKTENAELRRRVVALEAQAPLQ
jgi:hypothetical protein